MRILLRYSLGILITLCVLSSLAFAQHFISNDQQFFQVKKSRLNISNEITTKESKIWNSDIDSENSNSAGWTRIEFKLENLTDDQTVIIEFQDATGAKSEHSYSIQSMQDSGVFRSPTVIGSHISITSINVSAINLTVQNFLIIENLIQGEFGTNSALQSHIGGDWKTKKDVQDREILAMAKSVVSLRAPLASCQRAMTSQRSQSCTAFRVADDLFATSWHCVSEIEAKSCKRVKLYFDYQRKYRKSKNGFESRLEALPPTQGYEEQCEEIVYSNRNLDLAIMRSSKKNYSGWRNRHIFEFAGNANNKAYPFDGEGLRIIHYPVLNNGNCSGIESAKPRDHLPLGLRFSGSKNEPSDCRVTGYPAKNPTAHRYCDPSRDLFCNIKWPTLFPASPSKVCEAKSNVTYGKTNHPNIAFRHRCNTCGASSGAPILSTHNSEARKYKVIGVHQGTLNNGSTSANANGGIRTSAISDCLDISQLHVGKIVGNAGKKGASYWPYCKSDGTNLTEYLDCNSKDISTLNTEQRELCRLGYK